MNLLLHEHARRNCLTNAACKASLPIQRQIICLYSLMTVLSAVSTCSLIKQICNWRSRTTIQQNICRIRMALSPGLITVQ